MKETRTICDGCGRDMTDDNQLSKVLVPNKKDRSIPKISMSVTCNDNFDVCNYCIFDAFARQDDRPKACGCGRDL
jgi:hypothetical protein